MLSDPERRAAMLRDQTIAPGTAWPSAFTPVVETAIERAQTYLERQVLPHYAQFFRGAGAEAAVRLWQDADALVDIGYLSRDGAAPGLWARRRAAWWTRRIEVTMEAWPMVQASHRVRLRNGRTRIVVLPYALWQGGVREGAAVDETVLRLLIARYAQVWAEPSGVLARASGPEAIARARAIDDLEVRRQRVSTALTLALAGFVTLLIYSGVARW